MKSLRLLLLLALCPLYSLAQTIYIGDTAITQSEQLTASNKYPYDTIVIKYCGDSIPISIPAGDSVMVGANYCIMGITPTPTYFFSTIHAIKSPASNDTALWLFFDTAANKTYCGYCQTSVNLVIKLVKNRPDGNVCWVTVDSNSQHNVIIWDTTNLSGQGIDTFKLYFYNSSNVWQQLATRPFKDTAYYFIDKTNNPNASTVRYRILTHNSCGNIEDSTMSPWQNTMWLNNSGGIFTWSGTGYLIQNNKTPVLTYVLYRDTLGYGPFDSIGSVSGSQNVIADPNYSNYPNGRWYVGAILNVSGCPENYPMEIEKGVASSSKTLSRSNRYGKTITGIDDLTNSSLIYTYPNPVTSEMFINANGHKYTEITITDLSGRVVLSQHFDNQINISYLPCGLYFITLRNIDGVKYFNKIVKD